MKNFRLLPILFGAISILSFILPAKRSFAQNAGSGKLFGVSVCTGFYIERDDLKDRIHRLRSSSDSLRKEAKRLSDSLKLELKHGKGGMSYFYNDSTPWNRFDKKWWDLRIPEGPLNIPYLPPSHWYDFHWDERSPLPPFDIDPIPNSPDLIEPGVPHSPFFYVPPKNFEPMPAPRIEPFKIEPKEESNPIRRFKGWYFEKLADISK